MQKSRSGRGVQYHVIKFVSDIRQVDGFFPGSPVDTTNKTDHHDITEILLKVALSTHKQKLAPVCANKDMSLLQII